MKKAKWAIFSIALLLIFALALPFIAPGENAQILRQCISYKGVVDHSLFPGFPIDNDRKCHYVTWVIPKRYSARLQGDFVYIKLNPSSLYDHKGLAASGLNEIKIHSGSFDGAVFSRREAYRLGLGESKVAGAVYGMEVFDQPKAEGEYHYISFYPTGKSSPVAYCLVGPNKSVGDIKPHAPCNVLGLINRRLYAEYHIPFELLQNLHQINELLVNQVTDFIVKN